jgi:hypothetical protein
MLLLHRHGYSGELLFSRALGSTSPGVHSFVYRAHMAFLLADLIICCFGLRRAGVSSLGKGEKAEGWADSDKSSLVPSTHVGLQRMIFEPNISLVLWLCFLESRKDLPSAAVSSLFSLMCVFSISGFLRSISQRSWANCLIYFFFRLYACSTHSSGAFYPLLPPTLLQK